MNFQISDLATFLNIENTYHFWSNFGNLTCDWFSSTSVICHLKFNRVSDFQMFYGPIELREMKKETSLAITTLDESI